MAEGILICPLRDCSGAISALVSAFEAEWPGWYGPGGQGDAAADLAAYANPRGDLPVGVVALGPDGDPIGIAALKVVFTPELAHLTPWASAGWVRPDLRRRGLGAVLLRALEAEGRRLGLTDLYCATTTAVTLLQREGWTAHAQTVHDGGLIGIFRRKL
jgi:GNAT superfamily N-acetyltransferase